MRFRIFARLICAILCLAYSTALRAEGSIQTIVEIPGDCTIVQLAGKSMACAPGASVIYTALENGIIMFNLSLSNDQVLSFVGDHDNQPRAEEYMLFLRRIRVGTGAQNSRATDVTGTCKTLQTADAAIIHRIICNATDRNGSQVLTGFSW